MEKKGKEGRKIKLRNLIRRKRRGEESKGRKNGRRKGEGSVGGKKGG